MAARPLWAETPLIRSSYLSRTLGCNAYLKLENLQPSQSFKYRGISLFASRCIQQHGAQTHLLAASSGNAGYAVAFVAKHLGVRSAIYLHVGVSESTVQLLESVDARVVVVGNTYQEALREAEKEAEADEHAVLVPSYDHPTLWEGHASMVEEMEKQLPQEVKKPDAIFCSVGGGGLLGGVIVGCNQVGWQDVPIIAMETHGSNCFYESMVLNRQPSLPTPGNVEVKNVGNVNIASLRKLTSRAASLGATSASVGVVTMALERSTGENGRVWCVTVQDELSMLAALQFVDDHKIMVELACSTTLAPAYSPETFTRIMNEVCTSSFGSSVEKTVIFVVCGGVKVSLADMAEYRTMVGDVLKAPNYEWDVRFDGQHWKIPV